MEGSGGEGRGWRTGEERGGEGRRERRERGVEERRGEGRRGRRGEGKKVAQLFALVHLSFISHIREKEN